MTSWEYAIREVDYETEEGILRDSGLVGWELVAVTPGAEGRQKLHFKRPLEPREAARRRR